jgi:hypothetical protein
VSSRGDPAGRTSGLAAGRRLAGFSREQFMRAVAFFLPLAVLATMICGLIYLEVQQDQRSGANDPQFQLAVDAASRLDSGTAPGGVVDARVQVDPSTSLAPFVIVFDSNHSVLAANATLDGGVPAPLPVYWTRPVTRPGRASGTEHVGACLGRLDLDHCCPRGRLTGRSQTMAARCF